MRVSTGKVVGGKIVLEGEPWEEGTRVTVLAREPEETVELSPEEEAELLEALAEADAGDFISGEQVLRELWNRR
jgi:predicted transcriptional regulator